jgi:hypothetical protein
MNIEKRNVLTSYIVFGQSQSRENLWNFISDDCTTPYTVHFLWISRYNIIFNHEILKNSEQTVKQNGHDVDLDSKQN